MALFLVVYAPALAFIFLSMAKGTSKRPCASEEHHRSSVELNPQIPWTADPHGNVLDMSPRWGELTGMPPEEALGQGWTTALHPTMSPSQHNTGRML